MFKVICITGAKEGGITFDGSPLPAHLEIYEGEVYSVVSEINHPMGPAYILAERDNFSYQKWRFIPLSDISETEMKREYNVQPA